jgi:hypothetical protein
VAVLGVDAQEKRLHDDVFGKAVASRKRGEVHSAAKPQPNQLPLLREVEERAGERRSFSWMSANSPLSSILSPLLRRGERKKFLAARRP